MKIELEQSEYKGSPTVSIWELDTDDKRKGNYPVISFGVKKAKAILLAVEELKEFVKENEK